MPRNSESLSSSAVTNITPVIHHTCYSSADLVMVPIRCYGLPASGTITPFRGTWKFAINNNCIKAGLLAQMFHRAFPRHISPPDHVFFLTLQSTAAKVKVGAFWRPETRASCKQTEIFMLLFGVCSWRVYSGTIKTDMQSGLYQFVKFATVEIHRHLSSFGGLDEASEGGESAPTETFLEFLSTLLQPNHHPWII